MSVRKAAIQFSLPRQTLSDRAIGKIDSDCIFDFDSEVSANETNAGNI